MIRMPSALGQGYRPANIPNSGIKWETQEQWNVGLDLNFFNNRLNFVVDAYIKTSKDMLMSLQLPSYMGTQGNGSSALAAPKGNYGEIENKGIEVSFRAVPVRTKDFSWEINGNWSLNKNKLCELQDGWDPKTPLQTSTSTTIGGRVYIYSYVGQAMHQIYGKDWVRAPEGSYYTDENGKRIDCSGMPIINETTGYPSFTDPDQYIAQVNPDWRAGFGTTLRYKGLSLSATFTAQVGGNAYSATNFALSYQGKLKNSLKGRYAGMIVPGVNLNENGTYSKNTTITIPEHNIPAFKPAKSFAAKVK